MVAAPFFALLFAIIETSMTFFASQVLQSAAYNSARLIMTGQAQAQGMTAGKFQQAVCARAPGMFDCTNIYVNVQTFASFSNVLMLNPIQNGKLNVATMKYQPGSPGDIVVVQVFYPWQVFAAPLSFDLSNMSGGQRLLVGTAVFRNEPA